jgi:uncharacterized membrane protein
MNLLILGIIIFFSIHLVPISPLKNILINRLGENKYKGLYSLIALVGLSIVIYAYPRADLHPVWDSLPYSREIALVLMPISMVLLVSANIQTNIKRFIKHPMLIGILIWSFVHLIASGDLRSIILFASFGIYALIDIIFSKKVLMIKETENFNITKDIMVVVIALLVYGIIVYFHRYIAGVEVF